MCIIERDGKVIIVNQSKRIAELEAQVDLLQNEIFELRKGKDSQKVISELMAQVAALKEIAVSERANTLFNGPWDGGLPVGASYDATMKKAKEDARRQLAEKHPEVDWK